MKINTSGENHNVSLSLGTRANDWSILLAKASRSRKKPTDLKPVEDTSQVPKDLQDLWGAVEASATTFNLLQKGAFTHAYMNALTASLGFIAKMHEQCVEAALKHPQSDLIPELKELKTPKEKPADVIQIAESEVADGQSES